MKNVFKLALATALVLIPLIGSAAANPRLRFVCGSSCTIRGGGCAPGEMVHGSGESQSYIDQLVSSCRSLHSNGSPQMGKVFYVCYSGKQGFQAQDGLIYGHYVGCRKSASPCNPVYRTAVGESAADQLVAECNGKTLPPKR